MTRALTLVLALAWSGAAFAQRSNLQNGFPCPTFVAGWSNSYYNNPISSVQYDPVSQLLYIIWGNTQATAYYPVPISIIQTFGPGRNPVQIYSSYVLGRYNPLLLEEKFNCPILQESGGYIWTEGPSANVDYVLLLQNGLGPLKLQNGGDLWLSFSY
jgi:hypothetical protein